MKPLVVTLLLLCSVLAAAVPTSMVQETPVEDRLLLPVEEAGTAHESMLETLEESVDLGDAIVGVAVMNEQIQTLCRLEYGDEVCRAEGLLQ
jgi:hypothetical protein